MSDQVVLQSERPAAEILGRLAEVSPPSFGVLREGVDARIHDGGHVVLTARRPLVRNTFKPVFDARIVDHGAGSRMVGNFRLARGVRTLTIVLIVGSLGFLPGSLGLSAVVWAVDPDAPARWSLAAVPLLMPMLLVVLWVIGRKLGERDRLLILEHLDRCSMLRVQ